MRIRGKLDEALDLYSKAIGFDNSCVNAFLNRGNVRIFKVALLFKEIH